MESYKSEVTKIGGLSKGSRTAKMQHKREALEDFYSMKIQRSIEQRNNRRSKRK